MDLRYQLITLGATALLALGVTAEAASQAPNVMHATRFDESAPMRDIIRMMPPLSPMEGGTEEEPYEIPNILIKPQNQTNWMVPDYSRAQTTPFGTVAPPVDIQFDAITQATSACGCLPPDTNGDVSDQHYIQTTNGAWAVYNKTTGAVVQAPTSGNSFYVGFGGKCETTNSGDPTALWDAQAKRWVISQFVTSAPFAQCVAVSKTADPLGAYYRYEFQWPIFGDYPKMGIWTEDNQRQDAYTLITHEFGGTPQTFQGAALIAMQRDKMLAGDPTAAVVRFPGFDAYGVQPVHLSGLKAAPAGSCPSFVHFDFATSQYRFWDMCINWATPASTTISANPTRVDADSFFPYFNGIAQVGTASALASFGSNTMYRATARAFDITAPNRISLVLNHVVEGNTQQAGIKWVHFNLKPATEPVGVVDRIFGDGYEGTPLPTIVPQTLTTKTMVDQGTFSPDSSSRWMGGIAIDGSGNIGLGYSKSSSALNPKIMVTGRTLTDPPGIMRGEQACVGGTTGSQTSSSGRWGDYSSMSVDPVDQCRFYFTTEYLASTSSSSWRTRVCSFTFPGCGSADFDLVNESPARVEVCSATATGDPTWNLRAGVLNGFTGAVTLSAIGIPGGTTANFSANPIIAPGSSLLTLAGGAAVTAGEYAFSVDGVSGALTRSSALSLGVSTSAATAPTLVSPANNATGIKILPTLSWSAVAGALRYKVEVASDLAFTNIVASTTVVGTTWKVDTALGQSTAYYWRVTPQNYCGTGASSLVFKFTTGLIGQCPSGTTLTPLYSDDFNAAGNNGWTTVGTGATAWTKQTPLATTGLTTQGWGIPNNELTSDRGLVTPSIVIPGTAQEIFMTYQTYHSFEDDGPTGCWDNGTLDIKVGAGAFTYLQNSRMFTDPYDGVVSAGEANAGAQGWCHAPAVFPVVTPKVSVVDLEGFAGQSVQVRFRAVSDSNTAATAPNGMFIDNFKIETCQP